MYKRDIVNFLFIVSFTTYGVGNYIASTRSPSIGTMLSASVFLLIILFYILDSLYKRKLEIRVRKSTYVPMVMFLASTVVALFVSLFKHFPNSSLFVTISTSVLMLAPFHAFIVVVGYNKNSKPDTFIRLTISALGLLLLANLVGYLGGFTNQGHNLEGRLNLPFLGGLYAASSMMIFLNIIFVRQMGRMFTDPGRWVWRIGFLICNMFMIYLINSRLTIMLFALVLALMFSNIAKSKIVYWVSMFTIPIVLSLRLLLYEIMTLPVFVGILQRVDFEDVTSFHGRAYLWEIGMDWLLTDRRGLFFGNGTGGQYFLDLLSVYGRLWSGGKSDLMHFHSSSLEIIVNQGLFGYLLFAFLLYKVFIFYRAKYLVKEPDGDFLPGIVFLLFLLQLDTFVYLGGLGLIIFALLLARVCVVQPVNRPIDSYADDRVLTMAT